MSAHVSQSITRKSASNLALAFVLLPRDKREGMAALYAFCREVDDVADEESAPVERRRARLAAWRDDLRPLFQSIRNSNRSSPGTVCPSRCSTN